MSTHRRPSWGTWAALALCAGLFLWLGLLALDVQQLKGDARQLQSDVQRCLNESTGDARTPTVEALRLLRDDVGSLERHWGRLSAHTGWLWRAGARQTWWPWLARQGAFLENCLAAGDDLLPAAWWCALRLESAVENSGQVNTASGAPVTQDANMALVVGQSLLRHREALLRARAALAAADAALGSISAGDVPSWRTALQVAPLTLDAALSAAQVLVAEGERTYLLLIQNADELRASGGFISSVAALTVTDGRLEAVRYLNSYAVEAYRAQHPAPPAPLQRYMGAGVLLFRDANWSPDFPTSAQVLAALYQLDEGQPIDGVIAVDSTLVQLLLGAIGPLEIPRYGVTLTSQNVVETAIAFWERPLEGAAITEREGGWEDWLAHRKDFGLAFLEAGLARLKGLTAAQAAATVRAVAEGVRGKHLLAWALDDAVLQTDLRRAGLDGSVRQTDADYLMVVDSNVGWNKMDSVVDRAITYAVRETAEGLQAHLCLTYHNRATVAMTQCVQQPGAYDSYEQLTEQCYWNYVRVLVPRGARLLEVEGADLTVDEGEESGKAYFGTLIVVPPRETRTLCLTYELPVSLTARGGDGCRYDLLIQKQPGTTGTPVTVSLELADGRFGDLAGPWLLEAPGRVVATTSLDRDLMLGTGRCANASAP